MFAEQSYRNGVCNVPAYSDYVVKRRETDFTNRISIIFGHTAKRSNGPSGNALLLNGCESHYS
jgi:hypothetical protein